MTYLAGVDDGRIASLREIGDAQDIPETFLAKILQSLVHAGLAISYRGAHGGFTLSRPADEITVRAVLEAVDGPIALNACVLSPDDCERSETCRMHVVWVEAQERMMSVLEGVTLAGLRADTRAG